MTRQILEDLQQVPPAQLPAAAEFVRGHRLGTAEPVDRARHFERYFGVITDDEADRMLAIIEAECERIDPDGW